MVTSDKVDEPRTPEDWERLIKERDEKYPSMVERGEFVIQMLQKMDTKLTSWDMTCFSIAWLALQALNLDFSWMRPGVKQLGVLIYKAHYLMPEEGLVTQGVPHGVDGEHKPVSENDKQPEAGAGTGDSGANVS